MDKSAIVVLGMHRSGTSAVAGVLSLLGYSTPRTLLAPKADNPRGFFESRVIVQTSDRILAALGSSWKDWRGLDLDAIGDDQRAAFIEDARAALTSEFGDARRIVLKDPRICRLAPVWQPALADLGFETRYVLPLRPPAEVVASLNRRAYANRAESVLLWLRHVLEAEAATRDCPRAFVEWAAFLRDTQAELTRIAEQIGWDELEIGEQHREGIAGFLSEDLHHERPTVAGGDPAVHGWVEETYTLLCSLIADPAEPRACGRLDEIAGELDSASSIFDLTSSARTLSVEPEIKRVRAAPPAEPRNQTDAENASEIGARLMAEIEAVKARGKQEKDQLRATLTQAEAEKGHLRAAVAEIRQAVRSARKIAVREFGAPEELLGSIDGAGGAEGRDEAPDVSEEIDSLVRALGKQLVALSSRLQQAEVQLGEAKSQVEGAQARIVEAETAAATVGKAKQAAEQYATALEVELAEARKAADAQAHALEIARTELASATNEALRINELRGAADALAETLRTELAAAVSTAEDLQVRLQVSEGNRCELADRLATLEGDVAALRQAEARQQEMLGLLDSSAKSAAEQLKSRDRMIQDLGDELATARAAAAEVTVAREGLEKALQTAEARAMSANQAWSGEKALNARLQAATRDLEHQLTALRREHEATTSRLRLLEELEADLRLRPLRTLMRRRGGEAAA